MPIEATLTGDNTKKLHAGVVLRVELFSTSLKPYGVQRDHNRH